MGTDGAWQQPGRWLIPVVPVELDPIGTSLWARGACPST